MAGVSFSKKLRTVRLFVDTTAKDELRKRSDRYRGAVGNVLTLNAQAHGELNKEFPDWHCYQLYINEAYTGIQNLQTLKELEDDE